jgi:type II secretory pathway component PulM
MQRVIVGQIQPRQPDLVAKGKAHLGEDPFADWQTFIDPILEELAQLNAAYQQLRDVMARIQQDINAMELQVLELDERIRKLERRAKRAGS